MVSGLAVASRSGMLTPSHLGLSGWGLEHRLSTGTGAVSSGMSSSIFVAKDKRGRVVKWMPITGADCVGSRQLSLF